MKLAKYAIVAVVAACFVVAASARVVHDESVAGDLSDDAAAPTRVTLGPGPNDIKASIGGDNGRDVFAFTVPPKFEVTSISLERYSEDNTTTLEVTRDGEPLGQITLRDEEVGKDVLGRRILGADTPLPRTLEPGEYVFNLGEFGSEIEYVLRVDVRRTGGQQDAE